MSGIEPLTVAILKGRDELARVRSIAPERLRGERVDRAGVIAM
jgi:hypothetical protein